MSLLHGGDVRSEHPVDVVERLASLNEWSFDRDREDEISITVKGSWSEYQISFTWLEEVEALHLACAVSLKMNERRRSEVMTLLALVNEQLWVGHFGLWEEEQMLIFRHALLLSGGAEPGRGQCEAALTAALNACERYYQAFQFVLWAGKSAKESLEAAIFDTAGEA